MRISDWSSDVCSSDLAAKELKAEIPEWSDNLYGEIMAYGIAEGLDEADVRRIANPKVIKLLRKAMLYDKGEKVVNKKVKQTPTREIGRASCRASVCQYV